MMIHFFSRFLSSFGPSGVKGNFFYFKTNIIKTNKITKKRMKTHFVFNDHHELFFLAIIYSWIGLEIGLKIDK